MHLDRNQVKKFLSQQIDQLSNMMADLNNYTAQLETNYYRVTIFGSARIHENDPYYENVTNLAKALSEKGVDIVTGGGPGLMEAANKGAKLSGNKIRSIGISIELPFEQTSNQHLDIKKSHRRFSSRLDEFMRISHAVIVTPGGLGTLLELFYTWQLLQVEHIKERPIILFGKKFWEGMINWIREIPIDNKMISPEDLDHVHIFDSVEEVIEFLTPQIKQFNSKSKSFINKSLISSEAFEKLNELHNSTQKSFDEIIDEAIIKMHKTQQKP
ncbi:TIGR00730 family Rossman fold protein [Candidatus Uabimicrobium sp. HlEnr_7]|uniref:LOG family protein n=1 Tax=Candidatus Uabimicrobium helgolandensis TaxID=3095367 RepID=UPI00355684A0